MKFAPLLTNFVQQFAFRTYDSSSASCHNGLRVYAKEVYLVREPSGEGHITAGILPRDELALRNLATPDQSLRQAGILLLQNPQPAVARAVAAENLAATVHGTIVNDDKFEVDALLTKYAIEGRWQRAGAVEDAHHHGDFRFAQSEPTLSHPDELQGDPQSSNRPFARPFGKDENPGPRPGAALKPHVPS